MPARNTRTVRVEQIRFGGTYSRDPLRGEDGTGAKPPFTEDGGIGVVAIHEDSSIAQTWIYGEIINEYLPGKEC